MCSFPLFSIKYIFKGVEMSTNMVNSEAVIAEEVTNVNIEKERKRYLYRLYGNTQSYAS